MDLNLLLLIAFAHASAKGAPPETPIIENFLKYARNILQN